MNCFAWETYRRWCWKTEKYKASNECGNYHFSWHFIIGVPIMPLVHIVSVNESNAWTIIFYEKNEIYLNFLTTYEICREKEKCFRCAHSRTFGTEIFISHLIIPLKENWTVLSQKGRSYDMKCTDFVLDG